MSRLVEFPLEAGGSVLVAVDADGSRPLTRGGLGSSLGEKASSSFEQALARVTPTATSLIGRLRSSSDAPDEILVEFGLQLSGEAGAFIAKATTEANFKVTLHWSRSTP